MEGFKGFFPDAGAGPGEVGRPGTGPWARRAGFLWVISSFFTFRRPAVTASPLFSSAKTAATPPAAGFAGGAAEARSTGGGGGGGGGGPGGGGAAEVAAGEADALKSSALPP